MREILPDVRSIALTIEERPSSFLGDVRVILDDGTATELEYKGDGVQSLAALSVIQHYSSQTARAKEFILAIEEPEAHLHPKAIHALRSVLRDTAARQQVVLTTHSPLFVNRLQIGSNIIVERPRARPAANVQELREVLGVRTADNLEHAEVILVVEGREDERSLRAILASQSQELRRTLEDGTLSLRPLHGGGKLTYVLAELRDSLAAVHAFLDGDAAGEQAALAAEAEGLLDPPDRTLVTLSGASEAEFEDLIDPAVYATSFLERFSVDVTRPWMRRLGKGKWSTRLPHVVKASGQPWRPADLAKYKDEVVEAIERNPASCLTVEGQQLIDVLAASLKAKIRNRSG
jgi:putative ATP-dependent endonuclease of OLD family